mmetsp:Transcript_71403/g.158771  ORF Transcript_71403/g.158771 Transcript_71403/m.158771 type:complete len:88 (+) Transcript_71403:232-495(+)
MWNDHRMDTQTNTRAACACAFTAKGQASDIRSSRGWQGATPVMSMRQLASGVLSRKSREAPKAPPANSYLITDAPPHLHGVSVLVVV